MNALLQYLDLYREHRATIDAHAPEALNALRQQAFDTRRRLGRLPERGDEGFEKISVNDMFAPDFGLNLTRLPFTADRRTEFSCAVPHIGAIAAAMVVNDSFVPGRDLGDGHLPEGLEVMSLARAAELYPDLAVGQETLPADNAVVALNSLLLQDGVFVRVRRGVCIERPVQLLSIFIAAGMPVMAVRRLRIVVEDGARLSVLTCEHPRPGGADTDTLSCRNVDITLGRDAALNFYDLEEAGPRAMRASVLGARQNTGSSLNICSVFVGGGITRNEYHVGHDGESCRTSLRGLVIGGGNQVIDNASYVVHSRPRCVSDQLFKYALFDSAQGAFEGLVSVLGTATFTDARQTNRNLLCSPDARMHTMPQLIINCDEVKASHGATIGQLDDRALFYMRSRGIPLDEARMMLTNAFLTDVLDAIGLEALRDRLRHLVDKRLRGCGSAACDNCSLRP